MKISIKYHIPAVKLEFVNINLSKDNKIFLDPLKIRRGTSDFDIKCYQKIDVFIKFLLKLVRNREYQSLIEIIDNLYERNETRLGYSLETTYGKSMGANGGRNLIKLLAKEEMVKNGEVEDIFDCIMMVQNIGEDKVSDLITTIIFLDLIDYTQKQCKLWKIQTQNVEIEKLCWDGETRNWIKAQAMLPIDNRKTNCICSQKICRRKVYFFI